MHLVSYRLTVHVQNIAMYLQIIASIARELIWYSMYVCIVHTNIIIIYNVINNVPQNH